MEFEAVLVPVPLKKSPCLKCPEIHSYNFSMKNSCVQWVAKEFAIVLPYLFDLDLQYNLRQGWRHAFNGYCDHCSWRNWTIDYNAGQASASLRRCNQSVHVYQNCLEQSQKHVCNGVYDHYNYMETKLKAIFHWAEFSARSDIFFCLKTIGREWASKHKRENHSARKIPPSGKRPLRFSQCSSL